MTMRYTNLPTTDIRVSKICLGTMTFGYQNTEDEAFEQMDYALSQGVNFFDTAEAYPVPPTAETAHRTETYIGNWLKSRAAREKVVIATKVAGPGMSHLRGGVGFTRESIKTAIEGSLKRLQTDCVELYQLHWPQRTTTYFGIMDYQSQWAEEADHIAESISVMGELIKEGKIRHFGLSNESAWGLMKYLEIAKLDSSLPRPITVQNALSPPQPPR